MEPMPQQRASWPQPAAPRRRTSLTHAATRMPSTLIPAIVEIHVRKTVHRTAGCSRITRTPSRMFAMTDIEEASGSAAATERGRKNVRITTLAGPNAARR